MDNLLSSDLLKEFLPSSISFILALLNKLTEMIKSANFNILLDALLGVSY